MKIKNYSIIYLFVTKLEMLVIHILTDRTNLSPEHMEQYIIISSFQRVRS